MGLGVSDCILKIDIAKLLFGFVFSENPFYLLLFFAPLRSEMGVTEIWNSEPIGIRGYITQRKVPF